MLIRNYKAMEYRIVLLCIIKKQIQYNCSEYKCRIFLSKKTELRCFLVCFVLNYVICS